MLCPLSVKHLSAPGGWGNSWSPQGNQDYAYFESGFATGSRQLSSRQQDGSVQPQHRTKRHRRLRGPTRDQKIQIFFNITGKTSFLHCVLLHLHQLLAFSPLNSVRSPSKHPSAPVEERLNRSGQSEEAPANPGATDQPTEADAGQAAVVQFPRVLGDDCGRPQIAGGQEGVSVLPARLSAEGQDVW